MIARCHAPGPPIGLVEVTTALLSTATHSEVDVQEMPNRLALPSTFCSFHADVPPSGFVDVITFPAPSTAAQNVMVGHDTLAIPKNPGCGSTFSIRHRPPAGSIETKMRPWRSATTHNEVDGHETPDNADAKIGSALDTGSSTVTFQADAPPAGSVEVSTSPAAPTATHRDTAGQDRPWIPAWSGTICAAVRVMRQLPGPAKGSVEVTMSPCTSPATHSEAVGHEIADSGVCPAAGAPPPYGG